jgi:hypothetical protein
VSVHICRAFPFGAVANIPELMQYYQAIFLHSVMGWTQVGHTNFNVSGSFKLASHPSASINLGAGQEYQVSVPSGIYTASLNDVGRLIALRSDANPRLNSGLFNVVGVNVPGNAWILQYQSTQIPPAEVNTVRWAIYNATPASGSSFSGNASSGYLGSGSSAACSRIVLQSPMSSSWQVRLCLEPNISAGVVPRSQQSIAPGFGGTSIGDFQVGGEHLHTGMWWNSASDDLNATPGLTTSRQGATSTSGYFFMWGEQDTTLGSFVAACRPFGVGQQSNRFAWAAFGFCEDETDLPSRTSMRLFTFGDLNDGQSSNGGMGWDWPSTTNVCMGVSYGENRQPILGGPAPLAYNDPTEGTHPIFNGNAADSPFIGATELIPVDYVTGNRKRAYTADASQPGLFRFEARRLGVFPLARMGRDIGDLTTSTDTGATWMHLRDGVWLPWSGSFNPS